MSLKNNLINAYHSLRGGHSVEIIAPEPENISRKDRNRSATTVPDERPIYRERTDIRDLEEAITISENLNKYNRSELHRIYRQFVLEDPVVCSSWTNRKMKTLKRDFGIYSQGSEEKDKALTDLFTRPWFYDFIEKVLDSKAWGFSCLELYNWNSETQQFEPYRNEKTSELFDAVQMINPDYVKPETGYIVEHFEDCDKGLDIYDRPESLIFVGSREHGFFYKLAKPILFKDNALANWSEWIEVFGLDAVMVKTDAEGNDRREILSALKNFGSARVGTMDPNDELTVIGSAKTDAFKVFQELAKYTDSSVSKIIFGQDVISNNTGQVVGNVGENVANDYAMSDGKLVEAVVNNQLLPMMDRNGFIPGISARARFEYDYSLSTRELSDLADVDLKISQMGLRHNPDFINERYGVDTESSATGTLPAITNRLNQLYPK